MTISTVQSEGAQRGNQCHPVGNQWQSVVISGNQWQSGTLRALTRGTLRLMWAMRAIRTMGFSDPNHGIQRSQPRVT
jgi:hypothetical protein